MSVPTSRVPTKPSRAAWASSEGRAKFWAWLLEDLGSASTSDCVTLSMSLALSEPQFASYERGVLEELMLPGLAREGEEKGKPNSVQSEGAGYPSGPGSALLSRR